MISHLDFMEPSMPKNPLYRFAYHNRPCEPSSSDESPEEWCEIASYADEECEILFAVIVAIANTGCSNGVCANSVDVCRDMRNIARDAVESYGRLVTEESSAPASVAQVQRLVGPSRFYGHCHKCRHYNTCNLSPLPEGGCVIWGKP